MKIAIVGTGISGLVTARLLHAAHEITVYEANDYIGGHTHTVSAVQGDRRYEVDTGFIVCNEPNYPLFLGLMKTLGVETQPAPMSFSVRCERTGLEYCGTNLNTVFAQRANLVSLGFHRMLWDILRFNRVAKAYLRQSEARTTLGSFLAEHRFGEHFIRQYLLPMGAAIWSARPGDMLDFPARTLLRFFDNHRLLTADGHLQWRAIKGGSARYIEPLVAPFRDRIRLATPVESITRDSKGVTVNARGQAPERFDRIVLAGHSDESLDLLTDPSDREREILGSIPYQRNEVVLHTDAGMLPRNRRAWASWNYHLPANGGGDLPTVTYNMNLLQGLDAPEPFCVTLNRTDAIDPERILQRFTYHHPVFTQQGIEAQQRWGEIDGQRNTHFCGAYWGHGFHEDGVKSALAVGGRLGATL